MAFPRRRHDVLLLLDGQVLVIGGTATGDSDNAAVLEAELWDPDTETWTTMAAMTEARMYHSSAVLLTDGRVVAGGGESTGRKHAEIFSPPYLFKGPRPTIASAPAEVAYGQRFTVTTPQAADILTVAILRPSGSTHAIDYNQRYVPLSFTQSGQSLVVDGPATPDIAPPGLYLLVIENSTGVPSTAAWVRINSAGDLSPGALAGQVVDATTAQGLSGATVSYAAAATTTTVGGDYLLEDITPGAQLFTVSVPGYATVVESVTVAPAVTTSHLFALVEPGTVTGVVTAEETGLPLAGATVTYGGGTVTTATDGGYTISAIGSGSQTVSASALGHNSDSASVTVPVGGTTLLDFHLHEAHTAIEGEVLDGETGVPIVGATVTYDGRTLLTNEIGFYFFDDVPEGAHTVTASATGYVPSSLDVQVVQGFETTADFALVAVVGAGTPITLQEVRTGTATSSIVSTSGNLQAVSGALYLAAVSSKPYAPVNAVTGLGLTWARAVRQCSGRNQTGTDVWYAIGLVSQAGPVTAMLTGSPTNVVLSAQRFSGAVGVGNVVSGNTNGVDGPCRAGSDSASYALSLDAGAGAVVLSAVATRHRTHQPGPGFTSISEVQAGIDGAIAGVSAAIKSVPATRNSTEAVDGDFNGAVDWAAVGVEIRKVHVAPSVADVAVDFGGAFGVWGLFNNGPSAPFHEEALASHPTTLASLDGLTSGQMYAQIHAASPEAMATGDVDGSGQDDLLLDFPGAGVWIWLNSTSWVQLHPANAAAIATGDLDGNGQAEVILDFPTAGTWIRLNNSSWVQLHQARPTQMATGDLDGNGQDEVILAVTGFGVWAWFNHTSWVPLHPANVTGMTVGDLDGNGQGDLIADFPGFGVWVWSNNSTWLPLHPSSATGMATGDLDGNGQDEAIIDFPGFGLWVQLNNSSWVQLVPEQAEDLLTADIDGNGQADVVVDFGALGLRAWVNNTSWIQLHALSPEGLAAGNLDGI